MPEETKAERTARHECTICRAFDGHLHAMVELGDVAQLSDETYMEASSPIWKARNAHEADAHPTYAARIHALALQMAAEKKREAKRASA